MISAEVGVGGFEPPTTASQTRCASQLRYTPWQREYNANGLCPSSSRRNSIIIFLLDFDMEPVKQGEIP
jgi:hypothetical protein